MNLDKKKDAKAKNEGRTIVQAAQKVATSTTRPVTGAFITRLVTGTFDRVSFEDEVEITKVMAGNPQVSELKLTVPDPVIRCIVGLMRDHRGEFYPLGPRNTAACITHLNVLPSKFPRFFNEALTGYKAMSDEEITKAICLAYDWSRNQNMAMFLTKLYTLMHDKVPGTTVELVSDDDVRTFLEYLCAYGAEEFDSAVTASFMLDHDTSACFHRIYEARKRHAHSCQSTKTEEPACHETKL